MRIQHVLLNFFSVEKFTWGPPHGSVKHELLRNTGGILENKVKGYDMLFEAKTADR